MRRPLLKASPKMIARVAGFYAPLSRPAILPIAGTKAKPADQHQLELSQESQQSQVNRSQK